MMEPIYRCGYQIPSLIKLVFKLICFITIPFLITMMVKNLIVTNGIAVDHSFSFIIYPISLLITLGFVFIAILVSIHFIIILCYTKKN